ncbi:MAG: peptidogalycan biosysnthesis protein [Kofleriaceae bacterium]
MEQPLRLRVVTSVADVPRAAWDGLDHGGSPFRAPRLPRRPGGRPGSIGGRSSRPGLRAGVARRRPGQRHRPPSSERTFTGYIFDWAWARAAERAGLDLYPKVVVAAPMTPATGPRVLLAPGAGDDVFAAVAAGAGAHRRRGLRQLDPLAVLHRGRAAPARRPGVRAAGEPAVPLAQPRLPQLRRLPRRAALAQAQATAQGTQPGPGRDRRAHLARRRRSHAGPARRSRSLVPQHRRAAYGGADYLRPGFFERAAKTCADTMRVVEVTAGGARVAGALFFETDAGLYGRYWGADTHVELLHFEAAYYAGIDRCIARGLPLFEAGAQGEHKLLRGFEPAATYSSHWLREPRLHEAVCGFLAQEAREVVAQRGGLAAYGPYRTGDDDE